MQARGQNSSERNTRGFPKPVLTLAFTALLMTACATVPPPAAPANADCAGWFERLDAVTREAGVRDGSAHALPGHRFLRSNRFLASFGDDITSSRDAFDDWVARLAELDRRARVVELANLPAQFLPSLMATDKQQVAARNARCAAGAQRDLLASSRAASSAARRALADLAQVPDDYSTTRRALGLYELTRRPFFAGVQGWQQSTADTFAKRAASDADSPAAIHYTPGGATVSAEGILAALARRNTDALGVPRLAPEDEALLLRAYAPDVHIETRGAFDRFGALKWAGEGGAAGLLSPPGLSPAPSVATARPVMYQRLAYTRYRDQTLLQLVYSIWFPERPPQGAVDLLGGPLDSVVLRLTLAPDGRPWLYDSIHSCGCYHLFLPTPRAVLRPLPADPVEWAFVPAKLPALAIGQRVALHLASGTHYVEGLRAVSQSDAPSPLATDYALVDDDALRTLPIEGRPADVTRSAFWSNGIVPGTERGERIAFWPMGIVSPGAMRQWGRQPTAFVGRRHFDDARLMEQRFDLLPP